MNDLITKIQSELPGFSKGQKQIARFILEHYDKAAFMTASRLGVTVGVSESTVVRFATVDSLTPTVTPRRLAVMKAALS